MFVVFGGMQMIPVGHFGVMRTQFVIRSFVMFGGLAMVLSRMFVVFSGLLVVFMYLMIFHSQSPR